MASKQSLLILLVHLASPTSCVDSYPTSEAAPHVPSRRWQRKPATPLEHKIVFACIGGLLFLGIVAWIYRNFRRAPKPADPDPAASVEPGKADEDEEGVPQPPIGEARLPAVPYVPEP